MDTLLLILENNNTWRELDLFEELPINVIIQQTDVTDIETRRSPYSKTFNLPGTNNNNDFFEHFYEVNSTTFNPLTRKQCVVQYRGTDIFKGFLRLNAVTRQEDKIQYEVFILSEVTDFSSIITDFGLKNLSWEEYNHIQNYDTVFQSWYADETETNGLFGGAILYPMIHYGLQYQDNTGLTPSFFFAINRPDNKGIDFSGSSIPPTYFKPAIRLKAVIDKIFTQSGYEVVSEFFNSNYFKAIYMDMSLNGEIGITTASAKTNQNIFRTYSPALPDGQKFNYQNGVVQQIKMGRINQTDGYDPSFNWHEEYNAYQVPYSGQYSFEFIAKINQIFSNNAVSTYYGISIYKATTPQGLSDPAQRIVVSGTPDNLRALNYSSSNNIRLFFNNCNLNAGDWIGIFIRFNQSGSSYRDAGLWVGPRDWIGYGARWDLYSSPFFVNNSEVDIKLQLPDTTALDFIRSIIKMFNLVIVQEDGVKKLRIEPLNWYYSENFADTKDWTDLLDINQEYRIEPLNFQLSKAWNLQYLSGEDEELSRQWEAIHGYPFGTKKFSAVSDILTGESTIEFPFRPCPTEVISGSTNIIIPMFYKLDVATGKEIPYSNKPHLFFWTGNRYFYEEQGYVSGTTWYMTSGATPISQTTYPCVSHLTSLDTLDQENFSDLNFDKSFDFFGDDNTLINQFTANNIFQLWYQDYFLNLYSPETRKLTGRFLFNPLSVYQTKLTDKIFVKDSMFRIERINEADLVNWKLTEVSLLKAVAQYNKVVPPAPDYSIDPNQSYPAFSPPIAITGYVSTIQSEVCLGSISPITLYASSTPVTNGTRIYSDSSGLTPYTRGTYFRQLSGLQTFAVVNDYGQLLKDNC